MTALWIVTAEAIPAGGPGKLLSSYARRRTSLAAIGPTGRTTARPSGTGPAKSRELRRERPEIGVRELPGASWKVGPWQ